MFKNVCTALNEAMDITAHLKPLVFHFTSLETTEFAELTDLFQPLMHTVCLVYANSDHYNTPAKIITLMKEICNLLMSLSKKHMDPKMIFKIEVEEALDKVSTALNTLKAFKRCFREYKSKLPSYCTKNNIPKAWKFQEQLIFKNFDIFIDRLKIIAEFFTTSSQFLKLEKVEIGGIRGKLLTEGVRKIFHQFKDVYATFGRKDYDCSDPDEKRFLQDFNKFNSQVWMMDRKLAAALTRAFDDCTCSDAIFKLFDIFGNLLQRGLISLEVSEKMPLLAVRVNEELEDAKIVFRNQQQMIKQNSLLFNDKNVPIAAGQLKFSGQLRTKITRCVTAFKNINHPVCYSQHGDLVFQKYKSINNLLLAYEDKVFDDWLLSAEENTKIGLEKPIICRDKKSHTIQVNFSKDAMVVLTEVQYFVKFFPNRKIPTSITNIFKRFYEFRNYINMLDMVADLYNYLITNTADVDKKLIMLDMSILDDKLAEAETTMNWNSECIMEYIQNILEDVSILNKKVKETQDNVIDIYKEISKFEDQPLFTRDERYLRLKQVNKEN